MKPTKEQLAERARFVRFNSHRSRDKGTPMLANRQGFFSLRRSTNYGCYQATDSEIASLRLNKRIHFTVLREPYDDLRECW